ncbi:MAG: peptidyl-tRNA hydrolase Pth2 [Candidatus Micrarchaeia archaeon]
MASSSDPQDIKQVIVVRTDLKMGKGKIAAQAAHASIDSYIKAKSKNSQIVESWMNHGMPKTVLKVDSESDLVRIFMECADREIPCSIITDAGKTQIEPGSKTCVGIGPAKAEAIDRVTGGLALL